MFRSMFLDPAILGLKRKPTARHWPLSDPNVVRLGMAIPAVMFSIVQWQDLSNKCTKARSPRCPQCLFEVATLKCALQRYT
jgi:hypothetical protein